MKRLAKHCPLCGRKLVSRFRRIEKMPKGEAAAWRNYYSLKYKIRPRRVVHWWIRRVCTTCDVIVVLQPITPAMRPKLRARRPR